MCFYCSAIASWIGSSPIATLYEQTPVEYIQIDGLETIYVGDTAKLSIISNTGAVPNVTWAVTEEGNPDTEVDSNNYTTTATSLTMECSEAATYHVVATETSDETITDEFTLTVSELPGTVAATGYYGIPADENGVSPASTLYIDGTTVPGFEREGALVTDVAEAIDVTISYTESTSTDYSFYLTFRLDGTTYFITIATVGNYQNLSYSATAAVLYWNSTSQIWTNAAGSYFVGYYESYSCIQACSVSSYGPGTSNPDPAAHFIQADTGDTEPGNDEP